MRIVSVILVNEGVVHNIESFGIFEEQLSDEVVAKAEEKFTIEAMELGAAAEHMDVYIEDGCFDLPISNFSVNLVWSDI